MLICAPQVLIPTVIGPRFGLANMLAVWHSGYVLLSFVRWRRTFVGSFPLQGQQLRLRLRRRNSLSLNRKPKPSPG